MVCIFSLKKIHFHTLKICLRKRVSLLYYFTDKRFCNVLVQTVCCLILFCFVHEIFLDFYTPPTQCFLYNKVIFYNETKNQYHNSEVITKKGSQLEFRSLQGSLSYTLSYPRVNALNHHSHVSSQVTTWEIGFLPTYE